MHVTMKKIADLAGVSRGTVDRVLNGRGKVKAEVAHRIKEIAKTLDYTPNTVAKSLSSRKKKTKICVILHAQRNLFFDDVIKGVEEAATTIKDFGIQVEVRLGYNFDPDYQLSLLDGAVAEGFNAIAITAINDPRIIECIKKYSGDGLPIVLLSSWLDIEDVLAYVGCDYPKSGSLSAGLINLLTKGSAKIGIVSPPFSMLGHRLRIDAFNASIASEYRGLEVLATLEIPFDDEQAYIITRRMLEKHPEIDTLFYATGAFSGGLRAVKDLGLYGKLTIVSVDLAVPVMQGLQDKGITATICQNPVGQGFMAIRVLFDNLIMGKLPEKRETLIEPTIKIRESIL